MTGEVVAYSVVLIPLFICYLFGYEQDEDETKEYEEYED